MASSELLSQIESRSCPFVFRIVDRDEHNPGAGTAVLVSDTASDYGFALTCWHNIDWRFAHAHDWRQTELVSLPHRISALSASEHDLLKPGERIHLMGRWSNPIHDIAVLRLSRKVITAFKLRPAPITFHVRPGAPIIVRGFDRPWLGASLHLYKGNVPDSMDPFTVLHGTQRAFIVQLQSTWQRGLSGGAIFDVEQRALVGIACGVKSDAALHGMTQSHREQGYATAMHEVGESWTIIREHCQVVEPRGRSFGAWPLPPRVVHPLPPAYRYQPRAEVDILRQFWDRPAGGVLGIVGIGGAGKTSLVERFLQAVRPPGAAVSRGHSDLARPQALFVWSFYDAPHPDSCLDELLRYLEGDHEREGRWSLPALQVLIAGLERPRILIVLDGLERCQAMTPLGAFPPDAARLRYFLQWCAEGGAGIWVIIVSRLPFPDLTAWSDRAFELLRVDELDPPAAENLLHALGVRGRTSQVRAIVQQFGGHALTLTYLGLWLNEFHAGNVAGAVELEPPLPDSPPTTAEVDAQARRLGRLLAGYERTLQPEELATLKAISAFRRPVDFEILDAFSWEQTTPPAESAERVRMPRGVRLRQVLARLRELHLVYQHVDADGVARHSAHPAISQYFYRALQEDTLKVHLGASEYFMRQLDAHGFRVRTHGAVRTRGATLARPPEEHRPTDPVLLDLLEEAVYHTLRAGRVTEAWELYRDRLGGFEHLAQVLREYARGYRMTKIFLEHAADRQGATWARLAQAQTEHERFKAAFEAMGDDRP